MVCIHILPVLFSGLRALHPNPMVFKFILRVLFRSLGTPGKRGGVIESKKGFRGLAD